MMREAQRRIAGRMDALGLLDQFVYVGVPGADVHVYPDVPSTARRLMRLSLACAAVAAYRELAASAAGGQRRSSPFFVVQDHEREVGHIDADGIFFYSGAARMEDAIGWWIATDPSVEIPPDFDLTHGLSVACPQLYHLPTTDPNADLARFYFHRWLPAWQGPGAPGANETPHGVARAAWRVAARRILGADLPDPSTFVHLAAS